MLPDDAKESVESVPTREKYWEEMDINQKIEKLAYAVENIDRRVSDLWEFVHSGHIPHHEHLNGKVLIVQPSERGQIAVNHWDRGTILNREPIRATLGRLR